MLRVNNVLVVFHACILRLSLRRCHQFIFVEVLSELGRRLIPPHTLHLRILRSKRCGRRRAAAAPLPDVGIPLLVRVVDWRGAVGNRAWVEVRGARHVNSHGRVHCRCIVDGGSLVGRPTLVASVLNVVAEERLVRVLDAFASLLLRHLVVD